MIEVFRGPGETGWREHQRLSRGQTLEATLCGARVSLAVDEILGPPVR